MVSLNPSYVNSVTLSHQIGIQGVEPGYYRWILNPTPTVLGGNIMIIAVNLIYSINCIPIPSPILPFPRSATTDRRLFCEVQNIRDTRAFQTTASQSLPGDCVIASATFKSRNPLRWSNTTHNARLVRPQYWHQWDLTTPPDMSMAFTGISTIVRTWGRCLFLEVAKIDNESDALDHI